MSILRKISGSERGGMMVEAVMMLGMMSMVTPYMFKQNTDRQNEMQDVAVANQTRTILAAANAYVEQNYSAIADGNNLGAGEDFSGGNEFDISVQTLKDRGFLAAGVNATNAFDQTYSVRLKKTDIDPGAGQEWRVDALLNATGGSGALDQIRGNRIAAMVGSGGGYVAQDGVASGAMGAWGSADTSADYGVNTAAGDLVATTSYQRNVAMSDGLYRNAIPGFPDANTMGTDINMGGNNITNIALVSVDRLEVGAGGLDVVGDTDLHGTLDVDGATALGSTLSVTGATSLASTLTVAGITRLRSDFFVNNGGGSVVFDIDSATGNFHSVGNAIVDGTTTLNGATTINNTLHTTGAVDFDSTLNVDGATTLRSTLDARGSIRNLGATNSGNVYVDDNFGVSGRVGIGQVADDTHGLQVAGTTKLTGNVGIGRDSDGNALSVAGTTLLSGATSLGSTLAVAGTSKFTGNVGINTNSRTDSALNIETTNEYGVRSVSGGRGVLGQSTGAGGIGVQGLSTQTSGYGGYFGNTNATGYALRTTTGKVQLDGATSLGSTLTVAGATTINNTLHTTGAVDIDSNLNVDGGAVIDGATSLGSTLTVASNTSLHDTYIDGNFAVGSGGLNKMKIYATGAIDTTSTLHVQGATTLDSALNVAGASSFTGNVGFGQAADDTHDIQVAGTSRMSGNVGIGRDSEASAQLSVETSNEAYGTLSRNHASGGIGVYGLSYNTAGGTGVHGYANSASGYGGYFRNANTSGYALRTEGGKVQLDGATTMGSTLTVAGATAINNTLNVTGATRLESTLDVNGAISNGAGDVLIDDSMRTTGQVAIGTTNNINYQLNVKDSGGYGRAIHAEADYVTIEAYSKYIGVSGEIYGASGGTSYALFGYNGSSNGSDSHYGLYVGNGQSKFDDGVVIGTTPTAGYKLKVAGGKSSFAGDVEITGNTTATGNATVNGLTYLNGGAGRGLLVSGNTSGSNTSTTALRVNGYSYFDGNIGLKFESSMTLGRGSSGGQAHLARNGITTDGQYAGLGTMSASWPRVIKGVNGNYEDKTIGVGMVPSTAAGISVTSATKGIDINAVGNGINVLTTGVNTYGAYIHASGEMSEALYLRTDGDSAEGALVYTYGDYSEAVAARTYGANSVGAKAYTYGDNSTGFYASVNGNLSSGVYATTGGTNGYGVYGRATSASSTGGYFENTAGGYGLMVKGKAEFDTNITVNGTNPVYINPGSYYSVHSAGRIKAENGIFVSGTGSINAGSSTLYINQICLGGSCKTAW